MLAKDYYDSLEVKILQNNSYQERSENEINDEVSAFEDVGTTRSRPSLLRAMYGNDDVDDKVRNLSKFTIPLRDYELPSGTQMRKIKGLIISHGVPSFIAKSLELVLALLLLVIPIFAISSSHNIRKSTNSILRHLLISFIGFLQVYLAFF